MSDHAADDAVQVPSTPPAAGRDMTSKSVNASSPLPAGSMTPPPSTQPQRFQSPSIKQNPESQDVEPSSPSSARCFTPSILPTAERIANADIEELRTMVQDLIVAVSDARMSAAHFKLQHTLLVMETHEATQRAEVEHQMACREVEAMQIAEQRHRAVSATPKPQPSPQPQVAVLSKACRDLEEERDEIDEQLQQTKKYLEFERGRAEMLVEENMLLKKRIRENREHFTKLRDQSPMYTTPRQPFTTPRRKSWRFEDHTPAHDNFAALLQADQILSQEIATSPSTPTKPQTFRTKQGHVRGAHSMSSLQTTPARRIMTDIFSETQPAASAPGTRLLPHSIPRDREDRDSTISISEAEDEPINENVTQSQASSLATNMLRRNPASQDSMRQSQDAERSSNLLQSKLFGNVTKSTGKRSRAADIVSHKKARMNNGVGLGVGIDRWTEASS